MAHRFELCAQMTSRYLFFNGLARRLLALQNCLTPHFGTIALLDILFHAIALRKGWRVRNSRDRLRDW